MVQLFITELITLFTLSFRAANLSTKVLHALLYFGEFVFQFIRC